MKLPVSWKRFFQISLEKNEDTHHFTQAELLKLAKEDLDSSYALLKIAEDPDLVDHAIYRIKAAEKKYNYLLRQAKEQAKVTVKPAV